MGSWTYTGSQTALDFPPGLHRLNSKAPTSLQELQVKSGILDFWTYRRIKCMHIFDPRGRSEHTGGKHTEDRGNLVGLTNGLNAS